MAAALVGSVGSLLLLRSLRHRQHHSPSHRNFSAKLLFSSRIRATAATTSPASSSAAVAVEEDPGAVAHGGKGRTGMSSLACPICYFPLKASGGSGTEEAPGTPRFSFECGTCKKIYSSDEAYLDLTVSSGSKGYTETVPASTELFRSPLVSFLYERGWRQNFVFGGFPGPEKEVAEISRILRPGGVFVATTFILDGIFSSVPFLNVARQYFTRYTGQHLYFSEGELEDLCGTCGLVGFTCVRNGSFVMLSATKRC